MRLTKAQKRRLDRRVAVKAAHENAKATGEALTLLVADLADKYGVTEVTIYADIKHGETKVSDNRQTGVDPQM